MVRFMARGGTVVNLGELRLGKTRLPELDDSPSKINSTIKPSLSIFALDTLSLNLR